MEYAGPNNLTCQENNINEKFFRREYMPQNQQSRRSSNAMSSGTDPNKVKQEIQKDVKRGQGAMTSREAGAMRD